MMKAYNGLMMGAFLAISLPSTVMALETMRCGSSFIEAGDTEYEVLQECGEPTYINDEGVIGMRWIYEQGPGEFLKIVTFLNGKVQRIEMGDRQ